MHTQRGLWLFLVPSGLVLTLVLLYPLGYAIYLSFFNYYLGAEERTFVGLGNYAALLADERFWSSLGKTLLIVGSAVSLEFVRRTRGRVRSLQAHLRRANAQSPAVPSAHHHARGRRPFPALGVHGPLGLIDGILISFNIFPPDWLGSPGWARMTAVLADAWQFTPFMILVLYAGLNTVDVTARSNRRRWTAPAIGRS